MSTVAVLLVYVITLAIILAIPVAIGVFVYRDARRRGMNVALWTLIAVLAPSLIGFIIYLLVRGNHSDMKCPNCNTRITEQYVVCPGCGAKLKPTCPNCMTAVEPDWKVCPKCANPLPEYQDDVVMPVKPKDRALWKILIAVIVIPIVLIVLMIAPYTVTPSSVESGMEEILVEEYLGRMNEPRIEAWLDECDNDLGKAYALEYKTELDGQKEIHYLVYVPEMEECFNYRPDLHTGLFGTTLNIELENVDGESGTTVILVTCTGEDYIELKEIELDGVELDCEIIEVDYDVR